MRIGIGVNVHIPPFKRSGGGLPDKFIDTVLFRSPLSVSDLVQVRVDTPITILKNDPVTLRSPITVTESNTKTIV